MKKRFSCLLLICLSLLLCACGGGNAAQETESAVNEETQVSSEPSFDETTVPEPVYETRTVYLCVLETMTNYENNSTFKTGFSYDEYGNRISSWRVESDGSKGAETVYEYDEAGRLIRETRDGSYYDYIYNEQGLLTDQSWYSDGVCTSEEHYTYDEAGFVINQVRITRYSDEVTYEYQITYDENHREASVESIKNGQRSGSTKETYNEAGQVTLSKNFDKEDQWTSSREYEYDETGKLLREYSFSRSETQADYQVIYTYDENGLLLSKNVDYYYGYLLEFTYEPFEILVRVK